MTVRQMLLQLAASGYEVQVLGATIFDAPKGMGNFKEQFPDTGPHLHQLIKAEDGPLTHQLVVTYSTARSHMTTHEEGLWYSQYTYLLDTFKPDIVWFYGGQTLDMLIPDEARVRGIPSAFYLANGSYKAVRWCRDIDLVITDSQATADMYRKTAGFAAKPVGKFIDPKTFVAEQHERRNLLFVNPSWAKGASVVVQLVEKLERERPDIMLEVVEARADWSEVVRETTRQLGKPRENFNNVWVTPNTSDMRGPYSRARVLLAPSLWWESSGRVLAEAMLNGIPALITNRGGMPEMIDDAGIAFDFPESCYEEPHQHLLSDEVLQSLFDAVTTFYDDEVLYQEYVERAKRVGEQKHNIDRATERLVTAMAPLAKQRAGNKDFTVSLRKRHRQNLSSKSVKPEFKVDTSYLHVVQTNRNLQQQSPCLHTRGFDWQLKGKVIVLDNRAKLLRTGAADVLATTGAFGIVAFDPASEVIKAKQYEGSEDIQVFQHALLGDGQPANLHACIAPEMTSTLPPLPTEMLPEHHRQGTQVIAQLPINTIALDSIEGLENLDWLILDELSDSMAVLENGKQALKETLLIQARVAFLPTHERQPSLTELQYWASRNGFRFYRFNDIHHHSHIPDNITAKKCPATDQENADVLFLPNQERIAKLGDEHKIKLAFVLSTVFEADDMAYKLLLSVDPQRAMLFLESKGLLAKDPVGLTAPSKPDLPSPSTTIAYEPDSVDEGNVKSHLLLGDLDAPSNKKIVLMLSFGRRPWIDKTSEAARLYAKNIGADFLLIQESPSDDQLMLPSFKASYGRKKKEIYAYKLYFPWLYMTKYGYERVLLVDDSAVVSPNSPDIFAEVPKGYSGYAWSQPDEALISLAGISAWLRHKCGAVGLAIDSSESFYRSIIFGSIDYSKFNSKIRFLDNNDVLELDVGQYANTAVMIFDRSCVGAICPEEICKASELLYSAQPNQTLWWYLLSKHKAPVYKIDSRWNWLLGWGLSSSERRDMSHVSACQGSSNAYISHVTSAYKNRDKLIGQLSEAVLGRDKNGILRINDPGLFKRLISKALHLSKLVCIVQVGANDGKINDPIYDLVIKNKGKTKIALIEPQVDVIPYLEYNYRAHPQATVFNCAVGEPGTLILFRLKPEYYDVLVRTYLKESPSYRVPTGFSSFDKGHVIKHVRGKLPDNLRIEDAIEAIEVPCVNLEEIASKLDWEDGYDVLQIDTEGMDDAVIYASSIEKFRPKIINFEHVHLSHDSYRELCAYLASLGYTLYRYSGSDTLATLVGASDRQFATC
ncbi:glycosyltransferase [Halomonas sp. ANAO-440]|uniref:glycosyltransferase n=1 Tax=Halomonas sp. ANAO-440 TaxID=2861360 RepID=UPI001CAA4C3D|nr:glycosyltransferase [Halomonas sp. ANAO-440]MBZ0331719.1 glycosyltransferase [Halomonas sp. ANAO-440]